MMGLHPEDQQLGARQAPGRTFDRAEIDQHVVIGGDDEHRQPDRLQQTRLLKLCEGCIGAFDPAPASRAHDQLRTVRAPPHLVGIARVVMG